MILLESTKPFLGDFKNILPQPQGSFQTRKDILAAPFEISPMNTIYLKVHWMDENPNSCSVIQQDYVRG